MERFYGGVGFATSTKTSRGIWRDVITWRNYYGNVERNSIRTQDGSKVVPDIVVVNTISIVADAYANENFTSIRGVEWLGKKWKVQSVQVVRPRIVLTLGELMNENPDGENDE